MKIVENCRGLPLSVVVIAGILAKEAWNRKLWEEIAYKTGLYIVGDQNGCLETLALSYNNLPLHMRECFVYLGHFPEDEKFAVESLIRIWIAEGFIPEAGNGSLESEDIAESYLMDLIDRNLVIVTDVSRSNGAVKFCILHDLVRELCLRKAKEEGFFLQTERLMLSSPFSNLTTPPYKPVRMFINEDTNILRPSAQNLRSITLFCSHLRPPLSDDIAKYFCSLKLLRVLDLQTRKLNDFPEGMELLVHLRYLAIRKGSTGFPSSICNLWGLQTLIFIASKNYGLIPRKLNIADMVNLPKNMSNMVNLRHLRGSTFYLGSIQKPPMNLRTISAVALGYKAGTFQKCFPYIKELECSPHLGGGECDFKSLTRLEKLKITCYVKRNNCKITFPVTLRELTLYFCALPWSRMPIIQSLPNLQILKLNDSAFVGNCWNTDGQEFRQLTFLKLQDLDIEQWEACSAIFPCLRQLHICHCTNLKTIPLEIGDIPTLELIRCYGCDESVEESLGIIREEQRDLGNYDLKIVFKSKLMDRLNKFC